MTLFVDASAIVAMMTNESDALDLVDRLDEHDVLLWSPLVKWEAMVAISRLRNHPPAETRDDLDAFGQEYRFRTVAIGDEEFDIACDAFRQYGKRSGHAARLNMGDCFAYACARANSARLLYKGDDFVHTDLA